MKAPARWWASSRDSTSDRSAAFSPQASSRNRARSAAPPSSRASWNNDSAERGEDMPWGGGSADRSRSISSKSVILFGRKLRIGRWNGSNRTCHEDLETPEPPRHPPSPSGRGHRNRPHAPADRLLAALRPPVLHRRRCGARTTSDRCLDRYSKSRRIDTIPAHHLFRLLEVGGTLKVSALSTEWMARWLRDRPKSLAHARAWLFREWGGIRPMRA